MDTSSASITPASTTETSPAPRQHLGYLDGMRAVAALYIILHHCYMQVYLAGVFLPKWLHMGLAVLEHGHIAVDVFIVLSGFCLALPVVRGNGHLAGGAFQFFQKRARRILPPYFLALALSLLLIGLAIGHKTGTFWDASLPITPRSFWAHLFLIQDVFRDTSAKINYVFWSISVEWRIYFLFPLLMALRRRWNSVTVAVCTLLASYALLFAGQHIPAVYSKIDLDVAGVTPQYLGLFAMGLLGTDVAFGKHPPLPWLRKPVFVLTLLAASTLAMILVCTVPIGHGKTMPLAGTDFFVGIWAVTLIVAAANTEIAWLNRLFSWRPLVAIGTFAYSIYLIHAPLIQVVWQYVLVPWQHAPLAMFFGLCVIGTPLIVGCSYLFFLVGERPFLTKRKRAPFAETERDAALSPAP